MSDYLILDLLFGVIVVLFAAIGMWRGVAKEIPVTAAVFLGAALASAWSVPWGDDLARETDLRADVSRMIVTGVALFVAIVILGYGGGALIANHEVGWRSRIVGGILAAINGGLILHYVLNGVESFFTGESTRDALRESDVSRVLLREFGWLLVGSASLLALCVLIGALRGRGQSEPIVAPRPSSEPEHDHFHDHQFDSRGRPARLPRSADSGKFEPVGSGFDPQTGRYAADAPSIQQTVALPPVDVNRVAFEGGRSAPGDSSESRRDQSNPVPRDLYAGDEWIRRAPYRQISNQPSNRRSSVSESSSQGEMPANDDQDPATRSSHNGGHHSINGASPFAWIGASAAPDAEPTNFTAGAEIQPRRCSRCAGEVGASDDFCPHCGNRIANR